MPGFNVIKSAKNMILKLHKRTGKSYEVINYRVSQKKSTINNNNNNDNKDDNDDDNIYYNN